MSINWYLYSTNSTYCRNVVWVFDDNDQIAHIRVFPNPTSEQINIDIDLPYEQIEVELLNLFGQSLRTNRYSHHDVISMNINQSGVYIVKLRLDQGNTVSYRVVKN